MYFHERKMLKRKKAVQTPVNIMKFRVKTLKSMGHRGCRYGQIGKDSKINP